MLLSPWSKDSVFRECFRNACSGAQSVSDLVLALDLLPRLAYRFVGDFLRDDDGSVDIRENEISWTHCYPAAADRCVDLDHVHPSERIVRRQSSAKRRKAELYDLRVVSRAAIRHDAPRAATPRGGGKQPAPGGRQLLRLALADEDVSLAQAVDDLHL